MFIELFGARMYGRARGEKGVRSWWIPFTVLYFTAEAFGAIFGDVSGRVDSGGVCIGLGVTGISEPTKN
ncbi:uncharacterized protein EURHEDRAFT_414576 [Aspergillus ruber CBS 135680]|uniref:Uncharacterized protein n=1 Tax=Aspergillus ruber (strain CBS 135680) TaxID=1388766 RepID=A0A017S8R7_ASPRC|nr:uncharacterized protein EURHEDRAFT_414576 [Aspergillus ruber CBS 135680]EYE93357.1 hypothetical protein EURHEDRAFT_414576 [Aspergillus ruber CBS 135680]